MIDPISYYLARRALRRAVEALRQASEAEKRAVETSQQVSGAIKVSREIDELASWAGFDTVLSFMIYSLSPDALDSIVSKLSSQGKLIDTLKSMNPVSVRRILYKLALTDFGTFIDVLTHNAEVKTLSGNTLMNVPRSIIIYKTMDLGGYTLYLTHQPQVVVAETIENGRIIKRPSGGAGGSAGVPPGNGGRGGGGLIILAKNIDLSLVDASGAPGENGDNVSKSGAYNGNPGQDGFMLVLQGDSPGNGGNGNTGPGGKPGGGGGGGEAIGKGGAGGTIKLQKVPNTLALFARIVLPVIDWWIEHVLGKSPPNAWSIPNIMGAGGGGGADRMNYHDDGGGGGSGGEIIIIGKNISIGTVSAKGGNGGNGGDTGPYDTGGGGGGGGVIYVLYTDKASISTTDVSGGAGGGGDVKGSPGTSGTSKVLNISTVFRAMLEAVRF